MAQAMPLMTASADLRARYPEGTVYIDGAFVVSPSRLTVYGKQFGDTICDVGSGNADVIDAAVTSAEKAWPAWRSMAPSARAALLYAMADRLAGEMDQWISLEAHHAGKPLSDARIDIVSAVMTLRWFAGYADRIDRAVELPPSDDGVEGRACFSSGQYGGCETCQPDTADGPVVCETGQ